MVGPSGPHSATIEAEAAVGKRHASRVVAPEPRVAPRQLTQVSELAAPDAAHAVAIAAEVHSCLALRLTHQPVIAADPFELGVAAIGAARLELASVDARLAVDALRPRMSPQRSRAAFGHLLPPQRALRLLRLAADVADRRRAPLDADLALLDTHLAGFELGRRGISFHTCRATLDTNRRRTLLYARLTALDMRRVGLCLDAALRPDALRGRLGPGVALNAPLLLALNPLLLRGLRARFTAIAAALLRSGRGGFAATASVAAVSAFFGQGRRRHHDRGAAGEKK